MRHCQLLVYGKFTPANWQQNDQRLALLGDIGVLGANLRQDQ
jgi:hypothetical protein